MLAASLAVLPAGGGSAMAAEVLSEQKISDTSGSFSALLAGSNFARGVAAIGDLDGNGAPDMAVGYPDDVDSAGGEVFVLLLATDGTVVSHVRIRPGMSGFVGPLNLGDEFGASVTSLGDLDGDGVVDIAVGARGEDDGLELDSGAVWILFLNADGTVKAEQKINGSEGEFSGVIGSAQFGSSVACIGDLDADGVPDLAVGERLGADGGPSRGAVWILFLNPTGTVKAHQKISSTTGGFVPTIADGAEFGAAVGALGDLDNDGIPDLAVGAPLDEGTGTLFNLFLDRSGMVTGQQEISSASGGFTGTIESGDEFGIAVTSLGDLNGDGVVDLAVGARGDDDGGDGRGAVWCLFLNADGTVKEHTKISDTQGSFGGVLDDDDEFGTAVAALGDLDGDGRTELVASAPRDDDGDTDRGAAWLMFLDGAIADIEFQGELEFEAAGVPYRLAADDLNGLDGNDVVVTIPDLDVVQVFLNAGTIAPSNQWKGFQSNPQTFSVGAQPRGIAIGRFDKDAFPDVAVCNSGDDSVTILISNGLGGFNPAGAPIPVGNQPRAIAAALMNGDDMMDLVVANTGQDDVFVLFGTGDGEFDPIPLIIPTQSGPCAVLPEFIDEDKDTDLFIGHCSSSSLGVWLNPGLLPGPGALILLPLPADPTDLASADVDGNSFTDVLASTVGGTVSIVRNLGGGSFDPTVVDVAVGAGPTSVEVADLDVDGDADIAVTANDPVVGPAVASRSRLRTRWRSTPSRGS